MKKMLFIIKIAVIIIISWALAGNIAHHFVSKGYKANQANILLEFKSFDFKKLEHIELEELDILIKQCEVINEPII